MVWRAFARPGYAVLGAAVGLALLWPATMQAARLWPLLAGLVLFGLPHGAVDHHVPARLGRAVGRWRLLTAYAALTSLGLLLWALAPALALALFLIAATVHWGTGEVWFALNVCGRACFGRRWRLVAFAAARGLVPVAIPLLAHPELAAQGTGAILRAVGAGDAGWAPSGDWRTAGLGLVGAAVGAAVAASLLDHRGLPARGLAVDLGELGLLVLAMALVDPLFAVGSYFVAWHSVRHVARLMLASAEQARLLAGGRIPAALRAWHREAAPATLLSLAGLVLLCGLAWRGPVGAESITGAALALIAALTLPHAVVVAWMDGVQIDGAWRAQDRSERAATSSLRRPGTTARPATAP